MRTGPCAARRLNSLRAVVCQKGIMQNGGINTIITFADTEENWQSTVTSGSGSNRRHYGSSAVGSGVGSEKQGRSFHRGNR